MHYCAYIHCLRSGATKRKGKIIIMAHTRTALTDILFSLATRAKLIPRIYIHDVRRIISMIFRFPCGTVCYQKCRLTFPHPRMCMCVCMCTYSFTFYARLLNFQRTQLKELSFSHEIRAKTWCLSIFFDTRRYNYTHVRVCVYYVFILFNIDHIISQCRVQYVTADEQKRKIGNIRLSLSEHN